jgi:hypothetical protein
MAPPKQDGVAFQAVNFTGADGTALTGWFIASTTTPAKGTVILFGQSLGAARVLRVAGQNHFDGIVGVVEESGFASYQEEAQPHFSILGDLFDPG